MHTVFFVLFAAALGLSACASSDPVAEAKAREERVRELAKEQRANAARADADLRRATQKN